MKIEDNLSRGFYEKQCINEKWSVRELKRQKNSLLFERIALSKDKQGVLDLSIKTVSPNDHWNSIKPEGLISART